MKPAHIMLRVRSEKRSITYYCDIFDLQVSNRIETDGYTLVHLASEEPGFQMQLYVKTDTNLDCDVGTGFGHIGFTVRDIDGFRDQIDKQGYEPSLIKDLHCGTKLVGRYFFLTDPDGYRIKIQQDSGRFASI